MLAEECDATHQRLTICKVRGEDLPVGTVKISVVTGNLVVTDNLSSGPALAGVKLPLHVTCLEWMTRQQTLCSVRGVQSSRGRVSRGLQVQGLKQVPTSASAAKGTLSSGCVSGWLHWHPLTQ